MACRGKVEVVEAPVKKMSSLVHILVLLFLLNTHAADAQYLGKFIGTLSELEHAVRGEVYAVDSRTIHIKGFSYDGTAPDAFFYTGKTGSKPHDQGAIIPNELGSTIPLGAYNNKDVTLTLPDGLTLKDVAWISVWCRAYTIDFGHLMIPRNFDYPRPQKIDALPSYDHGVSSDRIVVVDAQTFLIPNFHYDGTAPDAFFWVGKGNKAETSGTIVPDENGSVEPLKKYSGKTIVITLPGDMTVFDIDYLSIWCRAFYADFGHVLLPQNLNVPPSLKMLGVAPQTKLNCEVLNEDLSFEVRWAVAGDSIVLQLVGKVENGDYMAFGLSGSDSRSVMVGGDVTVGWLEQVSGRGEAMDYHLGAKSQCQGGTGSCPDSKIQGSSDNVRLLNAAFINEFTMLTFQRPLVPKDRSDRSISTTKPQAVIWAIGPVNSQGDTSYHKLSLRGDMIIEFGRSPTWNCPLPEEQKSSGPQNRRTSSSSGAAAPTKSAPVSDPWYIPPIPCYEPEDGVFYAQIGPTGGDRGYNSITGHVGWGISWYINGLLIPEINVVRGKTYTFVVEGGSDQNSPAKYHPFYITDDPEGGYEFKTKAEKSAVRVFAGVDNPGGTTASPSAFGRLCEWKQSPDQPASAFETFGAYQRSLTLDCQEGQPGILQWTPDNNTPDTVYYQCFTHRFLGWKINVVDRCDTAVSSASKTLTSAAVPSEGGSRADFDYFTYDYPDSKTTDDAVTLGGSTRYEAKLPPRRGFNIDSAKFSKHNEEETKFKFDSFPFDMDFQLSLKSPVHNSISKNNKPASKPTQTRRGLSPYSRPRVPLGFPDFEFPKLPPIKMGSSVVNATAFSLLNMSPKKMLKQTTSALNYEKKEPTFWETSDKRHKELRTVRPSKRPVSNRRPTLPRKKLRPHFNIETDSFRRKIQNQNRYNIKSGTSRGEFVNLKHKSLPYITSTTTTEGPTETPLESLKVAQTSIKNVRPGVLFKDFENYMSPQNSFELKENPTETPIVIAKPYNYSKNRFLNNFNRNSYPPIDKVADVSIRYDAQRSNVNLKYLEKVGHSYEHKYESNERQFENVNVDPVTGIHFATNEGFNPETIVYENDFRPISNEFIPILKNVHSPIPNKKTNTNYNNLVKVSPNNRSFKVTAKPLKYQLLPKFEYLNRQINSPQMHINTYQEPLEFESYDIPYAERLISNTAPQQQQHFPKEDNTEFFIEKTPKHSLVQIVPEQFYEYNYFDEPSNPESSSPELSNLELSHPGQDSSKHLQETLEELNLGAPAAASGKFIPEFFDSQTFSQINSEQHPELGSANVHSEQFHTSAHSSEFNYYLPETTLLHSPNPSLQSQENSPLSENVQMGVLIHTQNYFPHTGIGHTFPEEFIEQNTPQINGGHIDRAEPIHRARLPSFKLVPPPPPPGSSYKRFARRMSSLYSPTQVSQESLHQFRSRSRRSSRDDSSGIEALSYVNYFPKAFKGYSSKNTNSEPEKTSKLRNISANERMQAPKIINVSKVEDYPKTKELLDLITKSTHLVILKDIWDNIVGNLDI